MQSRTPVAVVLNDGPSRAAAAVFTTNRVKAAPVLWTRQVISGGQVRAVVLNSGVIGKVVRVEDTEIGVEIAFRHSRRPGEPRRERIIKHTKNCKAA